MKKFQPIEHVTTPELVKRKIRQASAPMFVREFCQNAIEAARLAPIPRVKWWEFTESGCRKLCIWNNGPGMDREDLLRNMNLGASGTEKIQSAADNFGLGAKLTGLKANPAGLLWRSCKDGVVCQLDLGWIGDEPGIIAQSTDAGGHDLVLDVSYRYKKVLLSQFDKVLFELSGKNDCTLLDFDWTQVVFLGRDFANQDTVVDPIGESDPKGGRAYWLPQRINRRYFDLSGLNVSAICEAGKQGRQSRSCPGLRHLEVDFDETVQTPDVAIRYCLLTEGHASNELAKGYRGHAALVFRNEVYDGLFDQVWNGHATRFGVIAGSQRVAVQLILRDDFHATPNEQRTTLEEELPFGERRPLLLENYEELVEQHLPKPIRDYIADADSRRTGITENLRKRIKELMVKLGLRAPSRQEKGTPLFTESLGEGEIPFTLPVTESTNEKEPGDEPETPPEPPEARNDEPAECLSRFGGGQPAVGSSEKNLDKVPDIRWDPTSRTEKSLIGSFDPKHSLITLFEDHRLLNEVVQSVIETGVPKSYATQIREQAKEQIGYAAARHVLVAQSMLKRKHWTAEQRDKATTPESLTASIAFADMHRAGVEIVFRSKKRKRATHVRPK